MRRLSKILLAVAFFAWLAMPLLLLATGWRSAFAALEKRPSAEFPELAFDKLLARELYSGLSAVWGDRMPLREELVAVDSWIDLEVFGDSPSPDVLIGADGWLFSRPSILSPCRVRGSPRQVVATISKIDRIFRASGRRFLLVVAPNKEAIYPEYLGKAAGLAQCARDYRRELRSRLDQARLASNLDLWTALERLKPHARREIYWPHDTHWTEESGLEVTRQIVQWLDPELWDENDVVIEEEEGLRRGDLANMIGLPVMDPAVRIAIDRGVRVKTLKRQGGGFQRLSARGNAVDPRRVLVVIDSFGRLIQAKLSHYLAESRWIAWRRLSVRGPSSAVRHFDRAEVVIIQTVERSLHGRFTGRGKDFPVHLAGQLLDELPATRLELALARGSGFQLEPPGLVPRRGSARVLFDLPDPVVESDRYLFLDPTGGSALLPRVEARTRGRPWRQLVPHELGPVDGVRRVGIELPRHAQVVAIRPGAATLSAVHLLDVPR